MEKLLVFNLKGNFAHFNNPLTFSKYLKHTYYIPPKSTILGLLGSLIGLDGYGNKKIPEFIDKLSNINLYIKVIDYKKLNKMIVQYNSLNSFANNVVINPNVIMKEEILCNPKYEIGLLLDDSNELHNKIIHNIKNNVSKYHLYLGKNEFFVNIEYIDLFDFKYIDKITSEFIDKHGGVIIDSIFPIPNDLSIVGQQVDNFAYRLDNDLRYQHKKVIFNHKQSIRLYLQNNLQKDDDKLIITNNKIYYLF